MSDLTQRKFKWQIIGQKLQAIDMDVFRIESFIIGEMGRLYFLFFMAWLIHILIKSLDSSDEKQKAIEDDSVYNTPVQSTDERHSKLSFMDEKQHSTEELSLLTLPYIDGQSDYCISSPLWQDSVGDRNGFNHYTTVLALPLLDESSDKTDIPVTNLSFKAQKEASMNYDDNGLNRNEIVHAIDETTSNLHRLPRSTNTNTEPRIKGRRTLALTGNVAIASDGLDDKNDSKCIDDLMAIRKGSEEKQSPVKRLIKLRNGSKQNGQDTAISCGSKKEPVRERIDSNNSSKSDENELMLPVQNHAGQKEQSQTNKDSKIMEGMGAHKNDLEPTNNPSQLQSLDPDKKFKESNDKISGQGEQSQREIDRAKDVVSRCEPIGITQETVGNEGTFHYNQHNPSNDVRPKTKTRPTQNRKKKHAKQQQIMSPMQIVIYDHHLFPKKQFRETFEKLPEFVQQKAVRGVPRNTNGYFNFARTIKAHHEKYHIENQKNCLCQTCWNAFLKFLIEHPCPIVAHPGCSDDDRFRSDDTAPLPTSPRGTVLLINNVHFENEKSDRLGSDNDAGKTGALRPFYFSG